MALSETPAQPISEGRPASGIRRAVDAVRGVFAPVRSRLAILEVDTRLLGMVVALLIIWFGFNVLSGGNFLTPRNLWNLSVQSASIAIMATGMVLIIVTRNIDLSVGSMLGFLGYTMAMAQAVWIPENLGLGFQQPYTWIVALLIGVVLGALIGGAQGFLVAYGGVPSFIVTLGGLLIWRGLIFRYLQGQTLAPLDSTFQLLGGGPKGSLGDALSWGLGILACLGIAYSLIAARRRRRRYGFPVRPMWAEVGLGAVGSAIVLGAVWIANSYPWPVELAKQYAQEHGITPPAGGLIIPTGVAFPVVILLIVGLVMSFLATRRRFGRYVYAIGGNPEAAELGGINTRWQIMKIYILMGILCAISAAISSAQINGASNDLGAGYELLVISAAVVGGTSFAGGIGTIPGAVLGAFVMQAIAYGLSYIGVNSPGQNVAAGIVLILAVGFDTLNRRRGS